MSLAAQAQTTAPQSDSRAEGNPASAENAIRRSARDTRGGTLEEVVVTAQLREERPIEVPMSIAVLSSEDLQVKGIEDAMDLAYASPGMYVQEFGPGRQVIYMRGVGNRVGTSALTGIYLDEVPLSAGTSSAAKTGSLDLRTLDLKRVEVLKGPQGTLYGAGAVSGTVRFITNDPQLGKFSAAGEAIASYTEDGDPSQKITAVINVPAGDTFGIRVAATGENNGGWVDRPEAGREDVNANELTHVRVKGLWQPTESFQLEAMAIVNRNRDDDSGGVNHSNSDGTFRLAVDPAREYEFRDDYELYNVTATYDFGGASLLSSSSYFDHEAEYVYALIGGAPTVFPDFESASDTDQNVSVFSQEVRLASVGNDRFSWTTGVFYQDVKETTATFTDTIFGTRFPTAFDASESNNSAWALFGDISYSVTERWKLGAGARYFEDDREVIGVAGKQVGTFDKVTWRATTSYAFQENIRAYVNVGTGFRSGGFSNFGFPPFGPEIILTYEAGVKSAFPEHRATIDFAVFRSDYDDYLRRGIIFNPVTGRFAAATANIGEARISGAELSIAAGLTEGLTLSLTGSYTDGELAHLAPGATGAAVGIVGDPIDYIPKWSYSAGLNYDFLWGASVPGFARVDYSYRDRIPVTDRGSTAFTMWSDETAILDARVGMDWGRYSLQLFGRNLTNDDGSIEPWIVWNQAIRNRPRTFGLRFAVDFQ